MAPPIVASIQALDQYGNIIAQAQSPRVDMLLKDQFKSFGVPQPQFPKEFQQFQQQFLPGQFQLP